MLEMVGRIVLSVSEGTLPVRLHERQAMPKLKGEFSPHG